MPKAKKNNQDAVLETEDHKLVDVVVSALERKFKGADITLIRDKGVYKILFVEKRTGPDFNEVCDYTDGYCDALDDIEEYSPPSSDRGGDDDVEIIDERGQQVGGVRARERRR